MLLRSQASMDVLPQHEDPIVSSVETVYRNVYIYAGIDPYVFLNDNAWHSVFHMIRRNIGTHRGQPHRVYT